MMPVVNENVTVKEALRKGKLHLMYIPVFLLFFFIGLYGFGLYLLDQNEVDETWVMIVFGFGGIILVLFLPFIYYYIKLPRWRIWAYTNVRNVHELKRKAILARILYEDDSFYMRFEIKSAEQKEQLRLLQQKFERPDEFIDDPLLPFETVYEYGKAAKVGFAFAGLFFCMGLVVLYLGVYSGGAIATVFSLILGIFIARRYNKMKGATLTFSNEGVNTYDKGFHSWKDIRNEKVHPVGSGKNTVYYFSYDVSGETINISLAEFSANPKKADHAIRVYRGRFEAQKRRV